MREWASMGPMEGRRHLETHGLTRSFWSRDTPPLAPGVGRGCHVTRLLWHLR